MLKLTRRVLIKQASIGAGAVGMFVTTLATKMQIGSSSISSAKAAGQSNSVATSEALVICITDPGSGTLTVLRGENETTINNAALVQRLLAL